ncbi:hypothetical protein DKZ29_08030 [Limosilactobacillus reuteri]|uniref:Uncharacterized protein n=1 Tax=Limosilactobacillus reuteri TaxID=1598 RepID=A0ABD6Y5V6_LIMRT|nr:hypothetical protein [Limosilactobacillus reuteri]PWT35102.1 hypothetical protein DKZ24_05195 [Limosilactobacillus reuteri]PWT37205.1 hypothetical protein DKZ35_06460 [Limosilactobacillus reuteri]PWT57601.1 hypothetical protein DKZ29_08030 [Limosilactobacillus reuteri]PWT59953.1 hypothetical protein DKZ30_04730 [Limosilactobacillus reuteri]PWT66543.1 hypothetical protein DKZ28_04880 [Limosilactobacillus reuteri]
MAKKLDKELERGKAQFAIGGTVTIKDSTFPEKDADGNFRETVSEKTGFSYMKVGFSVKANDSQSAYVTLFGGHNPSHPEKDVIYATNTEKETTKIKWSLRKNEEILKSLADWSFVHIQIEKDENGELISKKFLSQIDAIIYLSEHLKDGMDIRVSGTIDYQEYNGEVQRTYNVSRITLNTPNKDGKVNHYARIRQTYLVDDKALSKHWEEELENDGKTTLSLWVPQYVGGTTKKVLPMAQDLVVGVMKDNLDLTKKIVKKLFIPSSKAIREIHTIDKIVYGVKEEKGQVEFTPEVQELIDMGFMDKEDVENADTITGNRVDEIVFERPAFEIIGDKKQLAMADRYAPEAITVQDSEEETIIDADDDLAALWND